MRPAQIALWNNFFIIIVSPSRLSLLWNNAGGQLNKMTNALNLLRSQADRRLTDVMLHEMNWIYQETS